jgi:hypothetical protein
MTITRPAKLAGISQKESLFFVISLKIIVTEMSAGWTAGGHTWERNYKPRRQMRRFKITL